MKLFHYAQSSSSYRVRIALALKDLDVEYVTVSLPDREQMTDAYRRINPQGLVPCLETDGGVRIGQALAIVDYLEALCPTPSLYPESAEARAQARALALMVACEAQPLQASAVARYLLHEHGCDDAQVRRWRTHWLDRALTPVERFVAARDSDFVFGHTPGLVECFVIPQLHNISSFGLDLPHLTHLYALERRCLELDSFRHAHPDTWT